MNQPCTAECVQPTLSLGKTRPKIGLGFASDWLKKQKKQRREILKSITEQRNARPKKPRNYF